MAKLEIIKPTKVFETLKLLAKIGIAGIITPNPTATRKDIEVKTDTSRGSPSKGERGRLNLTILQRHLGAPLHGSGYLEVASPVGKGRRRNRLLQRAERPKIQLGMNP